MSEQTSLQQTTDAPRTSPPKKKRSVLRWLLIIIAAIVLSAGALAAGYFGTRYYMNHIREETDSAKTFNWEGDYVDQTSFLTTMSISGTSRKGFYDVTICMGEENTDDLIFWTFTAAYNKETNALVYANATRKDLLTVEDDEGNVSNETDVVYTDGTGYLTVDSGRVTWTDKEENFGKDKVFAK